MNYRFTTLILLVGISVSYAQVPIGHYYDTDALPTGGYYDPVEYNPANRLSITHFSDGYEKGKIYFANGSIVEGLIRFENKKVWFKKRPTDKKNKIKAEEVKGLIIGIDSFFVATNFSIEQKVGPSLQTSPQFMQYLTSFGDLTFACHYFFTSGMAQGYGMASPVIETYQVRKGESSNWQSFPNRSKAFREMAVSYFGHLPYLKEEIITKELDHGDLMTLIKTAEYYHKYQEGSLIYFDKYWQEVPKKDDWVYEAAITSIEDSIWTVDFYKGNMKVQTGQYSGFYPYRRNGLFTSYYPDGSGRSLKIYENNQLKQASIFYPNGWLYREYELIETKEGSNVRNEIHYLQMKDPSGMLISKTEGSWTETVNDTITARTIFNEFSGTELIAAFREENGQKIYQTIDPYYNFKLSALQKKLSSHFADSEWREAVADNAQGTVFIAVIIDQKGTIQEHRILNSLHPEIDDKIKGWASLYLPKGSYRMKFKPYKVGDTKVAAEFVIPVQFGIRKFYREPVQHYNDWNMQFMMQQQMMTPPPVPARF